MPLPLSLAKRARTAIGLCLALTALTALPASGEPGGPPSVVANGPAPALGRQVLHLEEMWRIGGEDDEENLLGVVDRVLADDKGNVYLLDIQLVEVQVFGPDGRFARSLGQKGDGPGEVRNVRDMLFLPDRTVGLVQGFPGRIVKVDLDGLPAGEIRPGGDDPSAGGFFVLRSSSSLADHLVLGGAKITRGGNTRTATYFLAGFDQDGAEGTRYLEAVNVRDFTRMEFSEKAEFFPGHGSWTLAGDGRVFIAPARNEYRIEVHRPDGSLEKVITRPYESWRRTPEETERAREMMMPFRRRNRNDIKLVLEPTERDILDMHIDGQGQLWVLPSRGIRDQEPGIHSTWDVFDAAGAFVRQEAVACEGNGRKDTLFFPGGGLAVLVREHADAVFAFRSHGANNPDDEEQDAEARPLEVVCYRMSP